MTVLRARAFIPPNEIRSAIPAGGLARQAVPMILQFLHPFGLPGKRRLLAYLLGEAERFGRVELAIEIGMDQQH
jgi:hypothetical protein